MRLIKDRRRTLLSITCIVLCMAGWSMAQTNPGPPKNVAVAVGNLQMTLTWAAPDSTGSCSSLSYQVQAYIGTYPSGIPAGGYTTTNLTYTFTGLTPGNSYYFALRSFCTVPATLYSTPVYTSSYIAQYTLPGAPTTCAVSNVHATSVTLSWTNPGFIGGCTIGSVHALIQAYIGASYTGMSWRSANGATTAAITGLTPNTNYTFRIYSECNTPATLASSAYCAVPCMTAYVLPGPPANIAVAVGNMEMTLSWTAPSDIGDCTFPSLGYRIDVYALPGGVLAGSYTTANLTYTVTGLTAGSAYYFVLRSLCTSPATLQSTTVMTGTYQSVSNAPRVISPVRIFDLASTGNGRILRYALPRAVPVSLNLYDANGRRVGSFVNAVQEAGSHSLALPSSLATGAYILVFTAGSTIRKDRIMVVK